MAYPRIPNYRDLVGRIEMHAQVQCEYGAKGIEGILLDLEREMRIALDRIRTLPVGKTLAVKEPNDLGSIQRLRPRGPRRLWSALDPKLYAEKLEGAWLSRLAGCTLGAMVEGWSVADMEAWAKQWGEKFPPVDYWTRAKTPFALRYNLSRFEEYERDRMDGVPVDDDIIYTILALMTVEEYGPNFRTEDIFKIYVKYLPTAWLDVSVPLDNYRKGISALKAAEADRHPWCELIGADIRADGYGYMAPGWPERAAEMAYRDAYMTHRRNGVYAAMFFAATVSAAFAVDDPVDALKIGLSEIPRDCSFSQAVRWALREGKRIRNYREARQAVDEKFRAMHPVPSINNACLTTFGLMLGGGDMTKTISQTVAMGLDNDCTTATAGSIVGAIVGKKGVPAHWHKNFNDTVHSYLTGIRRLRIGDLLKRFARQAHRIHGPAEK